MKVKQAWAWNDLTANFRNGEKKDFPSWEQIWVLGFDFAKKEMVKEIQTDTPICGTIMELGEQEFLK